jgi:menaquinone-dependent protoporphyrinogen oxidase
MTQMLVAYGTRYGSTREVAEVMAETLEEQGIETEVKQEREVRSLDGYDAMVLGTPLYMGALHRDVRALLERSREALEHTPYALFALGPIKADDGLEGSREQLFTALARLPARLGFRDKMIAALPASPLHGEVAHDERDWGVIRAWAGGLGPQLRTHDCSTS